MGQARWPIGGSAAGDGGNHRYLGAVRGRRLEVVEEADVVVADVHVHEPAQVALVVEHPRLDAGVVRVEVVEHLRQVRAGRADLGLATGVGAQDGGDADGNAHLFSWRPVAVKAVYVGSMVAAGPTESDTASRVFRPMPVLITT